MDNQTRAKLNGAPPSKSVAFSTAMDHETEALEEVLRLHAFLAMVFVSHAVDGTGDTLCLVLLTLL